MNNKRNQELRKVLEAYAGGALKAVAKAEEFTGRWEMRYSGPAALAGVVSADQVQWIYEFAADGTFSIGNEKYLWKLHKEDRESFLVFAPSGPGAELYGERKIAFKMADGRLMLSNDDTSLVEILTKSTAKPKSIKRK